MGKQVDQEHMGTYTEWVGYPTNTLRRKRMVFGKRYMDMIS